MEAKAKAKTGFLQFRETVKQKIPLSHESSKPKLTERMEATLGIFKSSPIATCIFKVPNDLRKVNRGAYSPHFVSIGPLHQGEHDLLAMEEHKWRYMVQLLHRTQDQQTPNPKSTLDECIKVILEWEKKARGSYAEHITFNEFELAEILLVDGCFILELFLSFREPSLRKDGDMIFRNVWMVPTLRQDLLLLENQIPFFVLDQLFTVFKPLIPTFQSNDIRDLALFFCQEETIIMKASQDAQHLLDLVHKFYISSTSPKTSPQDKETRGFRKCATELLKYGIDLVKGTEDHLLDIKFDNGVITIPQLHINDTMDSILRNFIAFEQCSHDSTHPITSYAFLIKSLIRSAPDIKLLEQKEIITYALGRGSKDVQALFNNISKEVVLKEFYFGELCHDVNELQNSRCQRYMSRAYWEVWRRKQLDSLKRNYCSNAWVTISVIAAGLLLLLTILQTVYTVWSFYA